VVDSQTRGVIFTDRLPPPDQGMGHRVYRVCDPGAAALEQAVRPPMKDAPEPVPRHIEDSAGISGGVAMFGRVGRPPSSVTVTRYPSLLVCTVAPSQSGSPSEIPNCRGGGLRAGIWADYGSGNVAGARKLWICGSAIR
jgi:hypothetical protein